VPADDVVGFLLKVMLTLLVEAVQGLLLIVHRKVYAVPAVPVKVEVGEEAVPNDPPVPLTTVHAPVPTVGALPVSVTEVRPHVAVPV
jgi:hypothetical protein